MSAVKPSRIKYATSKGIANADTAAVACRAAGLPFYAACALLQKESGGKNVYGHDKGGALSGYPGPVNQWTYSVFKWLVFEKSVTSNGVGPCQLTYKGFFTDMEQRGMKPYEIMDNMIYGFRLMAGYYKASKSWKSAGTRYNGASAYGDDYAKKVKYWREALSKV